MVLFKSEKWLLSITSLILVSQVGAIVIRVLMSSWKLEEDSANESLKNAGMYIGIVERLMIFGFVVFDQWAAIGWLIAAKSIFRFSDLSRAKDRKLTEYMIIGTLLSVAIAISVGLLHNYIGSLL